MTWAPNDAKKVYTTIHCSISRFKIEMNEGEKDTNYEYD